MELLALQIAETGNLLVQRSAMMEIRSTGKDVRQTVLVRLMDGLAMEGQPYCLTHVPLPAGMDLWLGQKLVMTS